jgi:thymidine phosphorylase
MLAQEVIRRKRDGAPLTAAEVRDFIAGLTSGAVSEGQAAAFAMAVYFKGMSRDEAVGLTLAMRDSGTVLRWDLHGPVVDKHSSGGIGDNVSLMLAPMLAACGLYVPMISGRGLGHTGGTLDKLDAIPGYRSQPDLDLFRRVTREAGCAIIGQTADLAPADRRLYGIRDVTATVESVPLITASILSKKLAAGLDRLVLDVKAGSGAFMATEREARQLAESLVAVANGAGLATTALITDMDEPLAPCAGNAIEVAHAALFLRGEERGSRLHEVTLALGAELLIGAGIAAGAAEAREQLTGTIASGAAAERFDRMVRLLGGPADFVANHARHLAAAPIVAPVHAESEGVVAAIATRDLGIAIIELGGGRRLAADRIDHRVGLSHLLGKGERADRDRPLAMIHGASEADFARAAAIVRAAYRLGEAPPARDPVLARLGAPA